MSRKRRQSKKGHSKSGAKKKLNIGFFKDKVRRLFFDNPEKSFTIKQVVAKSTARDKSTKNQITNYIFELEDRLEVKRTSDGRFTSNVKPELLNGIVDHVNARFAYVIPSDGSEDIWVKTTDLMHAVDGDTVEVSLKSPGGKEGSKREGKVQGIIKRGREEFVGRVVMSPKFAFVIADNKKIHVDIFVYPEKLGDAKDSDKVIVKIDKWHNANKKSPEGTITEVLGKAGENNAEIHAILAEFGLPFRFQQEILQEADQISEEISKQEIKQRKDFRDITTFTIDPFDAKDFDDALSFRKLDNGHFEIGVHIADVTHYVRPGMKVEEEGSQRATSVYLVDRTVPMLPERLSNQLCSLRPHEEKLTFSAVFELDENAVIQSEWFGRTIIYSDRRFTYEEAQERIETGEGDFTDEIKCLNQLAKKIRKRRFNDGAVNFETVEVKFRLDEEGKPLEVVPKIRKDAHKLIEEFMLLANKRVAEFIAKRNTKEKESAFVYRVHDEPDPEKLDTFTQFAQKFGHKVKLEGSNLSSHLNNLMEDIEGKPEQNILESLAIRSMAKARYTTDPRAHFGLAFTHYTHFTSPIRRYPDMMVHRLLQHYLDSDKSADKDVTEELCVHSSEMEKKAADAERASIKFKQVEFMSGMLGRDFDGIISGITEWGIYVEIVETKCEGMIRITDLDDDYYEYDEKNLRLIGQNNKRMFTLGDKLEVTVAATDIDRRTIDLALAEPLSDALNF